MRSIIKLSSVVLTASLLAACGSDSDSDSKADASAPTGQIKNVIMMIGDGMGPQQVGLLSSRYFPGAYLPRNPAS